MRSSTSRLSQRLRCVAGAAAAAVLLSLTVGPPAFGAVESPRLDEAATTAAATGDVVLAWQPVEGATSYRVTVSDSPTFSRVLYTTTTPSLRATPSSPLPSGTIHWRVEALEGSTASAPLEASFTRSALQGPNLIGPGAGGTVADLAYPTSPPVLSWHPVVGAKAYRVELSTDDTFPATLTTKSYTTSATSHALTELLDRGPVWRWRVRADLDNNVTTQFSAAGQFRLAWPQSQPVLQGAAAGRLDAAPPRVSDIDLRWSHVDGAAKYEVAVSTDPSFASAVPGTPVTVLTNQYTPTRSFDNGSYFWRVTAIDPAGARGASSPTAQFLRVWSSGSGPVLTDTDRVAAPQVLSATGGSTVSQSDLELSWTAVPRASVYEVWLTSETSNFFTNSTKVLRCYTPHTSATPFDAYQVLVARAWAPFTNSTGCLNNLGRTSAFPADGTYRWRVRALDLPAADTATHQVGMLNVDGSSRFIRSSWSDSADPGNPASFVLGRPRTGAVGLTPVLVGPEHCADPLSGECTVHPDAPTLEWDPVDGAAAGYWVELALDAEFTNMVGEFHTLSSRLRLNGGLLDNAANQAYHWRVMGCSSFSSFGTKSCLQSGSAHARAFLKRGRQAAGLATAVSGDHATFTWDEHLLTAPDGGGTRGYELEVTTDALFTATKRVLTTKVDQPFHTTSLALLDDGTLFWRVRPLDGAASALPWSAGEPFTKSAPTSPTVTSPSGPNAPVLRWSGTPGTASYDVQVFRGGELAGEPLLTQTGVQSTSFVPASLSPGRHSWRVRRVDAHGNDLPWAVESPPRTFDIASDAVSLVTPRVGATVRLTDRVLQWSPVSGAYKYRVQLSTAPGFSSVVESVDSVQTQYAPSGAYLSGTTYYWRVLPLHASGTPGTPLTTSGEARTITFWNVPSTPTSVKAAVSGKTVTLTWAAPSANGGTPLLEYVVRYRPDGSDGWVVKRVSAPSASLVLDQLEAATKYHVQVAARNDVGTGVWSTVVTATTAGVPTAPVITKAVRGDTSATVTWTAPTDGGSGITSYTVTSSPGGLTATFPGTARTGTVAGLTNGNPYTFTVLASNSVGNGPASASSAPVTPAAGSMYVPVDPVRVLAGHSLGAGQTYTLNLTGVPVGASAVTFNLAAAGVTSNTYVTACPGGTTASACSQKASLNTDRRDRSNLVTVKLGGSSTSTTRSVLFYNNLGNVLLFADLQGFHVDQAVPGADTTTGSQYRPVDPTRVLSAVGVGPSGGYEMVLREVPLGATAVTFNLAAAGVTANTYVTACPGGTEVEACKQKASLNALPGNDTANLVTVKLGGDPASTERTVLLYNNLGDVLLYADLQGWFLPARASTFVPREPTRVLSAQSLGQGGSHTLTLTDVPVGATAVAFNLAAAGVTGNTYVSVCPGGTHVESCKLNANLLTKTGNDAAVFVVVKLGGDPASTTRTVLFYNNVGGSLLYADLQGFYA